MPYIKKRISANVHSDVRNALSMLRTILDTPTVSNINCWISWEIQMNLCAPINDMEYLQLQSTVAASIRVLLLQYDNLFKIINQNKHNGHV